MEKAQGYCNSDFEQGFMFLLWYWIRVSSEKQAWASAEPLFKLGGLVKSLTRQIPNWGSFDFLKLPKESTKSEIKYLSFNNKKWNGKKGVLWCLYLIFRLVWSSVVWKNPYNVSCSESVINDFVPSYLWALDCPHQALLPKKKENVQASSLSLQKKCKYCPQTFQWIISVTTEHVL